MAFVRQVLVIMAKDLRAELRTKEAINASLSFALVVLLFVVPVWIKRKNPWGWYDKMTGGDNP